MTYKPSLIMTALIATLAHLLPRTSSSWLKVELVHELEEEGSRFSITPARV